MGHGMLLLLLLLLFVCLFVYELYLQVCDDGWGYLAADVVCKQMGFSRAISALSSAAYGVGAADKRIWLDQVTCTGSEADLSQCSHNPFGQHDCTHSEDASVVCSEKGDVTMVT